MRRALDLPRSLPPAGATKSRTESNASAMLDPAATSADWQTKAAGSCFTYLAGQDWGVLAGVTWFRIFFLYYPLVMIGVELSTVLSVTLRPCSQHIFPDARPTLLAIMWTSQ